MIILKVQAAYFAFFLIDPEGEPPVARDVQAPDAFPVAAQGMGLPDRNGVQLVLVFHVIQEGQHFTKFVHGIDRQPFGAVLDI